MKLLKTILSGGLIPALLLGVPPGLIAQDAGTEAPADQSTREFRHTHEPSVGVFGDVVVVADESVEFTVTVLGDYELRGRTDQQAVTVLGKGRILSSGEVGTECVTVLGEVSVEGPVQGNLVVVCSKAYINAPIRGDAIFVLSEVEFGPNADIRGTTTIVGPKPTVDPDATFRSSPKNINLPSFTWLAEYLRSGPLLGRPIAPGLIWVWYIVLAFFLFRLFVLLLFPRPIVAGADVLRDSVLRSFLIGVIAYILYAPALGLLVATGVGAIAIPFVALAWEVAVILGKISVILLLGAHFGRQLGIKSFSTPAGGFIIGTVLLTAVYMVPVLGGLVHLLIKPLALGCMIMAAVDAFQRERKPPTLAPETPAGGGPAASAPTSTASLHADAGGREGAGNPPVIGRHHYRDLGPEDFVSLPRVGFWPRFGATILDFILVMVTVNVVLHTEQAFPLAWLVYHVGLWTWRGTTLGGVVFSLRLVKTDGSRVDLITALVRAVGSALSLVVAGLGFFWASWSPEKLSWHDKIAGTMIVKTPKGTPLL